MEHEGEMTEGAPLRLCAQYVSFDRLPVKSMPQEHVVLPGHHMTMILK